MVECDQNISVFDSIKSNCRCDILSKPKNVAELLHWELLSYSKYYSIFVNWTFFKIASFVLIKIWILLNTHNLPSVYSWQMNCHIGNINDSQSISWFVLVITCSCMCMCVWDRQVLRITNRYAREISNNKRETAIATECICKRMLKESKTNVCWSNLFTRIKWAVAFSQFIHSQLQCKIENEAEWFGIVSIRR